MRKTNLYIGVVTFPVSEKGLIPLRNLVDILCSLANNVHLITGNVGYRNFVENKNVHIHGVEHKAGARNVFARAINYVWTQSRMLCKLIKLKKEVDLWLFFVGAEGLVLPMLTAKLLGRGVMIASAGSGLKVAQAQRDRLTKILSLLQSIAYHLSDRIVLYSEKLVEELDLQKYRNKIYIAQKHFLDFNMFKIKKRLEERDNRVGYIGTLSKAKGVPNFLEAIPRVLEEKNDLEFLIGGSGQLQDEIEAHLKNRGLSQKVKLLGWILHDEVSDYLNNLKLLVLPSYTEGLPNIILEAVACGTVVLATAVGAIPDVIKDGETGFIMEDNCPECIAINIIRALNHPNLEQITKNARTLIETEFTYEKAVERYRKILSELPTRN